MKIKVLGTQSPYNTKKHNCPGFLIQEGDHLLMLDCGSGTHKMLKYPKDLKNLSVIISHLHRDHYNDIYNLQYASFVFHNQKRIDSPINIYLPQSPNSINEDIRKESNSFAEYYEINENTKMNIGSMEVTFCKTDHPVETYAVKVTSKGKSIVYTSDTSFSARKKIVEFAKGAELLICEASLLEIYGFPEINSHLTAKQAGIIAKEAKVKELMLTHLWPEELPRKYVKEAKKEFKKVILAKEGKTKTFRYNKIER